MTKSLKHLLCNIAQLPTADVRWIMQQLPPQQMNTFKRLLGPDLLQKAKRFRKLTLKKSIVPTDNTILLPEFCKPLAMQDPLFIAIVLEQGAFSWEAPFLQAYDSKALIKTMLEREVPLIKTAVKEALFKSWMSNYE